VKKLWILGIGIIMLMIIVIMTKPSNEHHSATVKSTDSTYIKSQIPTLFLHGYAGSANSEKYMVQQAKKKGVTKEVITAYVSEDGKVELKGKLKKDATNPIVQIELENNKQGDLDLNAEWFKNFVGHSMGNLSFAKYMLKYGDDETLPQLNKEVNIAGTFNGVLNMNEQVNEISVDRSGKPSRMNPPYPELQQLKNIYKGQEIEVLNIYGDLQDGTNSDGRVSNSSSKSLKYLLGNSPKSYKETKYEGKTAQHSELHENKQVANEIVEFLWGR